MICKDLQKVKLSIINQQKTAHITEDDVRHYGGNIKYVKAILKKAKYTSYMGDGMV